MPVASAGIPLETPSSQNLPTAILPRALPATGSGSAVPIAVAAGLLVVGAVLIAGRRWPDKA
jgi:LPXTG-motif cell wall-anchored protein